MYNNVKLIKNQINLYPHNNLLKLHDPFKKTICNLLFSKLQYQFHEKNEEKSLQINCLFVFLKACFSYCVYWQLQLYLVKKNQENCKGCPLYSR